ncbi:MAG: glycosyltransferase [Ruminococcus sp.]|nr:glycosyltransferase [Ruminococcus sp.]
MPKTKVAVLIHGLGANGIDTLFANLSSYWDLSKFEITYLLAVDVDDEQFWEKKVSNNNVRIVHITDLDGKKLLKWPSNLSKTLRKYGPFDVIHVNMDMLNGINLRVAKKLKIKHRICHAHNSSNSVSGSKLKQVVKNTYLGIMKRWIKKYSTERVACSQTAGDYFFGPGNYLTIFNGIDTERFTAKHNIIKSDKLTLCTIGRIVDQKNPIFMVDVIDELYKLNSNIKFLWVGSGSMDDEVKNYIQTKPARRVIDLLGIRNDVDIILQKSSFFLLPSKYEGLPLVLVEAQASGNDCFVSDSVTKEADCGKCYYISKEKTPKQWAEEIIRIVDSKKSLPLNQESLRRFELKTMAEQLQNVYSK